MTKEKKQAVFLYLCTVSAVFLGVFSSIINTRFLDPIQYGNVRYVQNAINLISSFLLFGFFLSGSRLLALSKNEEKSREIRAVLVLILLVAIFVLVSAVFICSFFHQSQELVANLFILSIPVCTVPLLSNYVNTVSQGDNHILRIGLARVLPPFTYVILAFICFNNWGASANKMMLLQWGSSSLILSFLIISTKPSFSNLKQNFDLLREENKRYGLNLYIGSLVMVSTNYLAGISLSFFNNDNSEVGFYTLALTVTGPLALLPSIIGTTFFKKFATLPLIPPKLIKTTILLTVISCLFFIVLIKPLVVLLYTEQYASVGLYACILAIGFSIHGIGDMINRYLGSHGLGKCIRNASIANGIVRLLGFTLLVMLFNTKGALFTVLICDFIYSFVLIYYYTKFIKGKYCE